jgi:hypothetical protein
MDDLDELVISGVSKFPEVLPENRRCCKMDDANLEAIRINTGLWLCQVPYVIVELVV